MGSYGESYDNPKAYAAISDLATASSFRNGKIETDGGPYRVDSDPEAPSLMLVSKGLKRRKEGQEAFNIGTREIRSEEHTSELQSLMRNSYAVFCLKKKKHNRYTKHKK